MSISTDQARVMLAGRPALEPQRAAQRGDADTDRKSLLRMNGYKTEGLKESLARRKCTFPSWKAQLSGRENRV